jgi:uncharacterized RDD family membrane protein YckC
MHDGEPSMLRADGAVVLPEAPPSAPRPVARDDTQVVWAAGFWRRAGAAIFDTLIVLPLVLAVILSAAKLSGLDLPSLRHASLDTWLDLALAGDPAFLGALGLGLAVVAVYLLLFQALVSHTIGMRAFRLEIIDLGGAPLTPWRATLRTIGYLVGIATLGLGFLWVAFDREKRGLHDWLAGTLVTRPAPRGAGGGG